ncbi:8015_t:CDS:2 [Ambispora leptoticha]|uniref:8015_t:CDS:1 n=1 Tax=Ambispora leptoticha TaxID=144679 RepID=A0A9N8YTS1_9GLOM|nr:8015_t:CDS:2 [Ambispora leptoticha]
MINTKLDPREASPVCFNTCSTTTTNDTDMSQQLNMGSSRSLSNGQHQHLIGSQAINDSFTSALSDSRARQSPFLPSSLGRDYKNFDPATITSSSSNSYSGSFNKPNYYRRQKFPSSSMSRSNNNRYYNYYFNGQKSRWSSPSARRLSYSEIQWQNNLSNRTFGNYSQRLRQQQPNIYPSVTNLYPNNTSAPPSIEKATINQEQVVQQTREDSPSHLEKVDRRPKSNLSSSWVLVKNGLSIKGTLSESAKGSESEKSIELSERYENEADDSDQESDSKLSLSKDEESAELAHVVDQTGSVNELQDHEISDAAKEQDTEPSYVEYNQREQDTFEDYNPITFGTTFQKESVLTGHKECRTWQQKLFMQSHHFRSYPRNRYSSDDYSHFYPSNDHSQESLNRGYLVVDQESSLNSSEASTEFIGSAPETENYPPTFLQRKKRNTRKLKLDKRTSHKQWVNVGEVEKEEPYLVNLIFKICDALEIECKLHSPSIKNRFNCYWALLRVPGFKKTFGAHNEIREIVRETVAEMAIDHFRQKNPDTFKKVLEEMGSDVEELDHYCCVYKSTHKEVISRGGDVIQAQTGKKEKIGKYSKIETRHSKMVKVKISKMPPDQPLFLQNNNKVETKSKEKLSALSMQGYNDTSSKDVLENIQEDETQVLGNEIIKIEKDSKQPELPHQEGTSESVEAEMSIEDEDQISVDQLDEPKLSELPQHQARLESKEETADQISLSTNIVKHEITNNAQQQEESKDLVIIGNLMDSIRDTQQNDALLGLQLSNNLPMTPDNVENIEDTAAVEQKSEDNWILDQGSDNHHVLVSETVKAVQEKNDHKESSEVVTRDALDMQNKQQQKFVEENNNDDASIAQHEAIESLEQRPPLPQDDILSATIKEEDASTIQNGDLGSQDYHHRFKNI